MTVNCEIMTEVRQEIGKGASRRLRRAGMVPATLYGNKQAPLSIMVKANHLAKVMQDETFYTHILHLNIAGTHETVLLKDLQRHPYKPFVMHVDFMRVDASHKMSMHLPLHFVGAERAPGVVKGGGVITYNMHSIEVSCLPHRLPEFISVDLSNLALNHALHLSQLALPAGVSLVAHDDPVIVTIVAPHKISAAAATEDGIVAVDNTE